MRVEHDAALISREKCTGLGLLREYREGKCPPGVNLTPGLTVTESI